MDERQTIGKDIIKQIEKHIKAIKPATDFGTTSMNKAIEERNAHYMECIKIVREVCCLDEFDIGTNPYQE